MSRRRRFFLIAGALLLTAVGVVAWGVGALSSWPVGAVWRGVRYGSVSGSSDTADGPPGPRFSEHVSRGPLRLAAEPPFLFYELSCEVSDEDPDTGLAGVVLSAGSPGDWREVAVAASAPDGTGRAARTARARVSAFLRAYRVEPTWEPGKDGGGGFEVSRNTTIRAP